MDRKRSVSLFLVLLLVGVFLVGCNLPMQREGTMAKETSIALTEVAGLADAPEDAIEGSHTGEEGNESEENDTSGEGEEEDQEAPTVTPEPTEKPEEEEELGEGDLAEFIADVTIPDYSEVEVGDEVTKTWRIKNTGSTTWTTNYVLEFEKGEKLGASTQIPLAEEVAPGEMIDISIDFRAPTATGEYSSYWILKNDENRKVGAGDEGNYLSLYMIILAVDKDDGGGSSGGSSGGGSIAGGAKITGATVSVDNPNYTGSCPATLSFSYTVTTSNAGKVQFNLVFNVVSPSGYKFDPPPQYLANFTSGYTVYYDYLLFSADPVTATARVRAIGENEYLSAPVQFSVKCQ